VTYLHLLFVILIDCLPIPWPDYISWPIGSNLC
jgi:hypothetical protein